MEVTGRMNRIDELDRIIEDLDRVPFQKGQRDALIRVANWWLDHVNQRSVRRKEFFEWMRQSFSFRLKRCNECRRWKALEEFGPDKCGNLDGRRGKCYLCERERHKRQYALRMQSQAYRQSRRDYWRLQSRQKREVA